MVMLLDDIDLTGLNGDAKLPINSRGRQDLVMTKVYVIARGPEPVYTLFISDKNVRIFLDLIKNRELKAYHNYKKRLKDEKDLISQVNH
jgi:hypothetical protein